MPSVLSTAVLLGQLASLVSSTPTSANRNNKRLGISLPPLIPAIPGVTEPLASNAPPLPILQVPTPPLDSPPFTASNIKPKKIGYFWTGAGDNQHKDFLVTASLDDVSSCLITQSS
jgi:selenium-binding protein 1